MHSSPKILENADLTPFNTLNITAKAHRLARIESKNQLISILPNQHPSIPIFVLGGGSNVLFIEDFPGLVLLMAITGKEIVREDEEYIWLKVGAGESWHDTVRYCIQKGWGGIENLSLIPGTVGAAPIQNIGAYGVEFEEVFHSLTAIENASGRELKFEKKACKFGYRDSVFKGKLKGKLTVTDVTLRLRKKPVLNTSYGAIRQKIQEKKIQSPTIEDISNIIIEIRNSKLPNPRDLANAGSFFKNPVIHANPFALLKKKYPSIPGYPLTEQHIKVPAGWLIEQTGWKGKTCGPVGTYRQQALVIVNHGGATGRQVWDLAKKIQASVKQQFGVLLVPEVNVIGAHEK